MSKFCQVCGAQEDTGTIIVYVIDKGETKSICSLCLMNMNLEENTQQWLRDDTITYSSMRS